MQLRVYATLRDLLGASTVTLEVNERTAMRQVLRRAVAAYPQLARKLWDGDEVLSSSIQVLLNGRSIRFLDGLESLVDPGDRVDLFPPVGGG